MRSDVSEYDLVAPPTLSAALEVLAAEPGRYKPIAGGTELMVALSAGRLPHRHLLSINHLRELRFLDVAHNAITIGSGTTFTDLRRSPAIASDLPLLAQAASWTGSIANQNRGTLGGNIVNASPAADSCPALLAYDACLTLVSARGSRTLPYSDFHLGYKKIALAPDELLYSVRIERNFSGYISYARKVGARNAQAISKVALACLALVAPGGQRMIEDVRIGAASLRETPVRCTGVERVLAGSLVTPAVVAAARAALASEARPVDDIRSTAKYRAAVAANLLEEFLRKL